MTRCRMALVPVFAAMTGLGLPSPPVEAAVTGSSGADGKAFRHPDLFIEPVHEPGPAGFAVRGPGLATDLAALGAEPGSARYDVRAGRWGTLVVSTPLLPGRGNRLRWSDLAAAEPGGDGALAQPAWTALLELLGKWQPQLRIDLSEIAPRPRVTVSAKGTLIQIHAPRRVGGLPVRGAELTAVLSHGNLVLLGLNRWGDVTAPAAPAIDAARARLAVAEHLRPFAVQAFAVEPHLELIPLAKGTDAGAVVAGSGYDHRLAWVVTAKVQGDVGTWEGLVDATSGALLALEDTNQYQTARTVTGGVYPASNDGNGLDGVEHAGYPMPYTDVVAGGETTFATAGGGAGCQDGTIGTTLSGRYVHINDVCGPVNETSTSSLDLGSGAGTNCTVPPGHSAGDTHAARTTYYELNRIMEQARGYLPDNEWLQGPLVANVNIEQTCNAVWNGATVSFYREGGGCANTGELAGVVDHEWAHGLDNNDADPSISRPFEARGNMHAALRQRDSCIGRGFDLTSNCNGFGDPCLSCTGIDDVDFARKASGVPHGASWVALACPAFGPRGPCNRLQHCESVIVGEAVWDLFARDLQNPATFNYDTNTALEVATRLLYLGGGFVGDWYTCAPAGPTLVTSGCDAGSGYLNLLAADDDDGSLSNGTPHMTAIFDAFNRHGIACALPAATDFGCAAGPTSAPALTVTPRDQGVALSWTAVPNATRYAVYRAEGVKGCDAGKAKVAETSGTSYTDDGLLNDFVYHYTVLPIGTADSCFGRMSTCQGVVPVAGPNLAFAGDSPLQFTTGDGDAFLDNCEVASVRITLENSGGAPLSNVRIVSVAPVGNPVDFLTPFPVAVSSALSSCEVASASFGFRPQDMSFDGTAELLVTFTADETPEARTALLRYAHAESDFEPRASRTFTFETGLDGWQVVGGTWSRASAGGGAGGTSFYVRSSQNLDDQCDRIRSPLVRLGGASTLSLSTRYQIEPSSAGEHYDRANVGVMSESGARGVIVPDGGNIYTIPPGLPGGTCLGDEPGWNGTNPGHPGFTASAWSPAALSPGGMFSGAPVRLDVAYATDVVSAMDGFQFDEVTLTGFDEQVNDAQGDSCPVLPAADVGILKTDGEATAEPGAPIRYTLTVRNESAATLTSLVVHDVLPAALLSPVFTPSAGSYDPATGAWTGLSLAPGDSVVLTVSATVSPMAAGTLTNTATVAPGPLADPDPSDNSASDSDTVVPAGLYFDAFGDGSLSRWTFTGAWHEEAGFLSSPPRRRSSAVADDFGGCVECSLATTLRTGPGRGPSLPGKRVWIWFHWLDGANHVELELADGQAVLRRLQDGAVTDSASTGFTLRRNRPYQAAVSYKENAYEVSIDGVRLLTLVAPGEPKGGTFGFGSQGAVTSFDVVHVQ